MFSILGDGDIDGVLVQEMIPPGLELLVGITSGLSGLPPLLTLGLGGVQTELMGDVTSDCLPVDREAVRTMLSKLKIHKLFEGFRGGKPYDLEAALDAILSLANLAHSLGDRLLELEVNPLIVQPNEDGAYVADALVRLRP
jgi:acyl-CoA synthetase (NDP forming)